MVKFIAERFRFTSVKSNDYDVNRKLSAINFKNIKIYVLYLN